jgi:synaptojanin
LYHHYGRVLIVNLVDQRDAEKRVGDEYRHLFDLLVRIYQVKQKKDKTNNNECLSEKDFVWFDYHDQAKLYKNLTPEQFVTDMLIEHPQFTLDNHLERQSLLTYVDETMASRQNGILRINCIDCLDRTNNVQLAIGLFMLNKQLKSLRKHVNIKHLADRLKDMWINNGDHISRIYTGTGALGQRNKVRS